MKTIIDLIFLFAGKYIKGYRTIILAVATFVVGAWEWITGSGLFAFLCASSDSFQAFTIFCNITEAKFYATILMVLGVLNAIIRKLTDGPVNDPSALTVRRQASAWLPLWIVLGVAAFVTIAFVLLPLLINWISRLF